MGNAGYFNFLKQDVMLYYPNQIKLYKSVTSFIIKTREAMYIILIQDFFKQIIIKKDYPKYNIDHNVEKFNLIVRVNLDIFFFTKTLTQAN